MVNALNTKPEVTYRNASAKTFLKKMEEENILDTN